jgi:TPR repeat protein
VKENNPEAKLMLSLFYGEGKYVPKNVTESFRLMSEAAAQDFGPAKTIMGLFYDLGRGVPRNYVEAVRWYKLGAAKGCADAWSNLSGMHEDGKGTPKNYIKAHMWANLYSAKDTGSYSTHRRDLLEKIMTKEQIAQAQQLAARCQVQNFQNCD